MTSALRYLFLAMLINAVVWAASRPAAEDIPEGVFLLPSRDATLSQAKAALVLVPTDVPAGAVLEYMWEISTDGGTTWHEWAGGRIVGGPHLSREGEPLTELSTIAAPRVRGVVKLRLKGRVEGRPIRLARDAEERL